MRRAGAGAWGTGVERRRGGEGRGPWHGPGAGKQPAVPLLIGALTGQRQVRPSLGERLDQAIHITAERTAVSGNASRVKEHPGTHCASGSSLMALLVIRELPQ